jgi:hypothetical protein
MIVLYYKFTYKRLSNRLVCTDVRKEILYIEIYFVECILQSYLQFNKT